MAKHAKWTFMVYMAGNNTLSDAGDVDLDEMRRVGSTPDVNVVAQFANKGNEGTRRFFIQSGQGNDQVTRLAKTDCGDPAVVNDFVDWAADTYPADHYALILWNHGGGWEPTDFNQYAKAMRTAGFNLREAGHMTVSPLKKTFFSTTVRTILKKDEEPRAICCDDDTGHSLDTIELGHVLAHTQKAIGDKLDILGMDACLMSNLEVAYQAEPYVNYIVASEESEPGEGWPYDTVLSAFTGRPESSSAELTSAVVEAYIDFFKNAGMSNVTQSAFDLGKVKDAAKSVDALGEVLGEHLPEVKNEFLKAQKNSKAFYYKKLWDINQFSNEIAKAIPDPAVKDAAGDVQASLKPGPGNFVLAKSELGASYIPCGGVSIYLIPPLDTLSEYYADLAFTKDYPNWLKMLNDYLSAW